MTHTISDFFGNEMRNNRDKGIFNSIRFEYHEEKIEIILQRAYQKIHRHFRQFQGFQNPHTWER